MSIFEESEADELVKDKFSEYRRLISKEEILEKGCMLYGAGAFGRFILSNIRSCGIEPKCFIDRNQNIQGKYVEGVKVIAPEEIYRYPNSSIILCSSYIKSIIQENRCLKDRNVLLWSSLKNFAPIAIELAHDSNKFFNNEVIDAYSILGDDISKDIYKAFIKFNIYFDEGLFSFFDKNQYFPEDIRLRHNRFVDAGAADGDTLKVWFSKGYPISEGDRYFAFEPNEKEFMTMISYISNLSKDKSDNVSLYNYALGEQSCEAILIESGVASKVSFSFDDLGSNRGKVGIQKIKIIRLDDILSDSDITFIKADVEGNELSMLNGAEETIRRCKPDLAISVYHRYDDIWRIPLWIQNLNLGYKIFLRHHQKGYGDTVCYAISGDTLSDTKQRGER